MKAAPLPVGDTDRSDDDGPPASGPTRARGGRLKAAAARAGPWVALNAPTLLGVAVGAVIALWLTADVWGGRLPAGGDVTGHLIRTQTAIDLLEHGQLDGWSPRFGVGYQQSLFYGPGFGWIIAALRVLSLGMLSSAGALKVVMIGSVVAIPFAGAFLARSMGLSRRAAGIAAVLTLLASSPFGVGIDGLFESGLIPQQVGGVLFLVAAGGALRTLTSEERGWQVLVGVTVAAMVVTHLITVAILGLFLACALVALALDRSLTREGFVRLALSMVAAAGTAAFWILPFLAHSNLHGPVATWSTPPFGTRIEDIVNGRVLYRSFAAKAVLVGIAYGFVRVGQRRFLALLVVLGPIAALAIGHWSIHALPNELTLQLANRELGLMGILLTFPLAAGIAALADRLDATSVFAVLAALVVAAYIVVKPWRDADQVAKQARAVAPEMRAAASELQRLVPPGARFVTARDYPSEVDRTGAVQPDRWLAWASGRNTLNTFPIEVSSTPEASALVDRVAHEPATESVPALARYGVTHVVATSPKQVAALVASPRIRPVWGQGTMTILAVDDVAQTPAGDDRERLRLDIDAPLPMTATVPLAWSPKWHGAVNDEPVDLRPTYDGLISVDLPQGRSRIDFTFSHDGWDVAGLTVSLLFILGAALIVGRRRASDTRAELELGQDAGELGPHL
ncbi:MAG TPA: hypothetical protein VM121_00290 [Acidimicrobiales bacterium]|nr:hypothetical protein [Acidimicrobiales bacterium]